jgi:hypothetical protein
MFFKGVVFRCPLLPERIQRTLPREPREIRRLSVDVASELGPL